MEPIIEKWKSFNWEVITIDGHNMRQILEALDEADNIHTKPKIIIARTTKGRGVSFMENKAFWHGVAPSKEELSMACTELME
jgi:transketolase